MLACSKKEKVQEVSRIPAIVTPRGEKYYPPMWSAKEKARLDSNLNIAANNIQTDSSEGNYIWLGRRLAYLYQYDSAVKIFSSGLSKYPQSFKLLRHRGHRYITLRRFDDAIADLEKAGRLLKGKPMETEPDGAPNKLNIPLSSTQFNIWYHLGLAYYLKKEFNNAERAYLECLAVSDNDDLLAASADWLYMTYRRQGKTNEASGLLARINDTMKIIENESYLKRLNMYRGKLKPEDVLTVSGNDEDADLSLATQGYGVGNWFLINGDSTRAFDIFRKVTQGKHFAAFGFIAAEAELVSH